MTLSVAYAAGVLLRSPWLLADRPTEVLGLMVLSGFAHGGYLWFLSQAYARGGLVTTYPLARGTAPLIVAALGVVEERHVARTRVVILGELRRRAQIHHHGVGTLQELRDVQGRDAGLGHGRERCSSGVGDGHGSPSV